MTPHSLERVNLPKGQ